VKTAEVVRPQIFEELAQNSLLVSLTFFLKEGQC
jgi:hypothetical protein